MRKNKILKEQYSPFLKRLVLQQRAGIILSPRHKKRLEEGVSMVSPTAHHNRIVKLPKQIKEPQSFDELDDDTELDLDEIIMQEILREMGYGEDEEDEMNMKDIPPLTDEELQEIIDELELE